LEISLGIVVADVSYRPGDICDHRGNSIHSILVGRGMHTLGNSLWVVAWSVVTMCHCDKDEVVAAPG